MPPGGVSGVHELEAWVKKNYSAAGRVALLRIAGETIVSRTLQCFSTERDPYGTPWRRSMRAEAVNGQTLSQTGRLRRSFSWTTTSPTAVAVGTNLIYAAIHQHGGVIRAKGAKSLAWKRSGGGWSHAKFVTIPKRPMLPENGLPPAYEKAIASAWAAYQSAGVP